jgi:hypothetical protein
MRKRADLAQYENSNCLDLGQYGNVPSFVIIIQFNYFLCAASTAKRPITDTAQNKHLRSYSHNYYNVYY